MKLDEIKAIVKMMSENELTEFKVETEEYKLRIRRGASGNGGNNVPVVVAPSLLPAAQAPAAAENDAPEAEEAKTSAPAAAAAAQETINAPLVGTFYRAASPDAPTLVNVGDAVTPETVIGIIEAMKVMNEVKAEKSGVIKEILVENNQPVEYGQPLMVIG